MYDFVNNKTVQKLVSDTINGCDDGELFIEVFF